MMQDFYQWSLIVFGILSVGCAAVHYLSRTSAASGETLAASSDFQSFQRSYLLV